MTDREKRVKELEDRCDRLEVCVHELYYLLGILAANVGDDAVSEIAEAIMKRQSS